MENFSQDYKLLNHPFSPKGLLRRGAGGIIFENERFVAINKPSGLLTIPDRHNESLNSLYKTLQQQYEKIFIIHRLDKDTSGIILFAKDLSLIHISEPTR